MDKKVDRASDVEFSKAIAENLPDADKHIIEKMGVAYIAGKMVRRAINKNR